MVHRKRGINLFLQLLGSWGIESLIHSCIVCGVFMHACHVGLLLALAGGICMPLLATNPHGTCIS
jgi:hypothetical protein